MADSLVSSHVYEIIKTIYATPTADNSDDARVGVLQQTLSQLRLANIATLDACMNHFTRLIELTSADEQYIQDLATSLAPCILRPRTETSLTMEEKHAYRLVRDLFANKTAIFSELKRMSSLTHTGQSTASGLGPSARTSRTEELIWKNGSEPCWRKRAPEDARRARRPARADTGETEAPEAPRPGSPSRPAQRRATSGTAAA